jgi:NADP-dependent 3-hydroxy acid dehydrogenase YdfG
MSSNIEGKVVVITGASSGLGEATARRLARHGARLVLGARRLERLQALAGELSSGNDAAVPTDVMRYEQVKRLVDRAVQAHGRIDATLDNAGLMPHSPLERLKFDDWDRMIEANIEGVLHGIDAALPHMKAQKSGHVSTYRRSPATRRGQQAPRTRPARRRSGSSRRGCGRRSSLTSGQPSSRRVRSRPSCPTAHRA